jgi:hypothetical protein
MDENEPIADVLRDVLDLIDQLVARITDDEIEERRRRVLARAQGRPAGRCRAGGTRKPAG